jgi:Uma2 family endonuclease
MTFEEFLKLEGHYEYVNGEALTMSPVTDEHADLTGFLNAALRALADARGSGHVRQEPFLMRVDEGAIGRSPDVMFIAEEHSDRIHPSHLEGPADLAVEVVSPDSRARDRGDKFYEYEQAGVREYWILDPERKRAEFYVLGSDGFYGPAQVLAEGVYRSAVVEGLWIEVGWLWARPSLIEVLRAWQLV